MTPREDRLVLNSSWSDLLSGIFIDVAKLLAQELELAKLKLQEELRQAKAYFALVILGGIYRGHGAAHDALDGGFFVERRC